MTDNNPDEVEPTQNDAASPTSPPARASEGAGSTPPPLMTDSVLPAPPDQAPTGGTPGGTSKKRRWLVPAIALSALVVIAVGVVAFLTLSGDSTKYAITGTFSLESSSNFTGASGVGGSCFGDGGYDDIKSGLGVKVSDGEGKVIATGILGSSVVTQNPRYPSLRSCVFQISIPKKVPKTDFYSVEVGHRGQVTHSFEEMKADDWTLAFTLG